MSNLKVHSATLPGYKGPSFPPYLEELQEEFFGKNRSSFNGSSLEMLGYSVPGFTKVERMKTEDGYCWFWSMQFEGKAGGITVLFPWGQDFEEADGTSADRHIALYTKGQCEVGADTQNIVQRIITVHRSWAVQKKVAQQPVARTG